MTNEFSLEHLCTLVSEKLCVPVESLSASTSFAGDLGADSLDMVELVMELEDRLGVSVTEQDAAGLTTLGDALRFIHTKLTAQS